MQKLFAIQAKALVVILLLFSTKSQVSAQNALFVTSGKIEYEKRLNLYEQMNSNEDNEGWTDLMKKAAPKFKINYYDLIFTPEKSLYQPGRENLDNNKMPEWLQESPGDNNIIFTDFESSKSIAQKKAFDQVFLIQDSTRRIKWKITDERRVIAGFNCRRANAMIMDSIYVVAFYTDEILATGGPESFTGLPGMILGVALPHQHVTWFATKVEVTEVRPAQFAIPTKGKKVTNADLTKTLSERMKEWGKSGRRIIQDMML